MATKFGQVRDPAKTKDGRVFSSRMVQRRLNVIAGDIVDSLVCLQRSSASNPAFEDLPVFAGIDFGAMYLHPMLMQACEERHDFVTLPARIRVRSYFADGIRSKAEVTDSCLPVSMKGRTVVIVDDIIESGHTLKAAREYFLGLGASMVLTVAVLSKPNRRRNGFVPDWIGFEIEEDQWIVGLGLDSNGKHRHFNNFVVLRDKNKKSTEKDHRKKERNTKPR